jgi:ribosomal protein L3
MTRDDLKKLVKKAQAANTRKRRIKERKKKLKETQVVDTIGEKKAKGTSKSFKKYNIYNRPTPKKDQRKRHEEQRKKFFERKYRK